MTAERPQTTNDTLDTAPAIFDLTDNGRCAEVMREAMANVIASETPEPATATTTTTAAITADWFADELTWICENIGHPTAELFREYIDARGHDLVAGHVALQTVEDSDIGDTLECILRFTWSALESGGLDSECSAVQTLAICEAFLAREGNEALRNVIGDYHTRESDQGGSAAGTFAGLVLGATCERMTYPGAWRELWVVSVADLVRQLAWFRASHVEGLDFTDAVADVSARLCAALNEVTR